MSNKKRPHHLYCEAPICPFDPTLESNLDNWCWYSDEEICKKAPYSHIQKIQKKIQRLYLRNEMARDRYFTTNRLLAISKVRKGLKGNKSVPRYQKQCNGLDLDIVRGKLKPF